MYICRFESENNGGVLGFVIRDRVVPVSILPQLNRPNLTAIDLLPNGSVHQIAQKTYEELDTSQSQAKGSASLDAVALLTPIERPNAMYFLAGNYAAHIEEGGQIAAQRSETYPYVFMKPLTTLTHPNSPIRIPRVSPDHIDWECELAVIVGKRARHVSEDDALNYVAGYTVINDISDRRFRPNPERTTRERDKFFDWLHGKWHDTFCPMGPWIRSACSLTDPQSLTVELRVNGQVKQNAPTSNMIFPVAAIISFMSDLATLQPGDIISTGTPSGVGAASGTFLQPGDKVEAIIDGIGSLNNSIELESESDR